MWKEIPFWKKALWASIILGGIEECQKEDRYRADYNRGTIVETEYRTNTPEYRRR